MQARRCRVKVITCSPPRDDESRKENQSYATSGCGFGHAVRRVAPGRFTHGQARIRRARRCEFVRIWQAGWRYPLAVEESLRVFMTASLVGKRES